MNTLEPLCNFEQSKMLKELGFSEPTINYYNLYDNEKPKEGYFTLEDRNDYHLTVSRPTISLAKNWLYEKYKLWMETQRSSVVCDRFIASYYLQDEPHIHTSSLNPHTAESDCLTEVLKKLTSNKPTD